MTTTRTHYGVTAPVIKMTDAEYDALGHTFRYKNGHVRIFGGYWALFQGVEVYRDSLIGAGNVLAFIDFVK